MPEKELLEILENIHQKFNKNVFSFAPREKEAKGTIPFYYYNITATSITEPEKTRAFLLDVMGTKPKYATTKVSLNTSFFDSNISVTTPTVGALLGDKLTTIGPNTMGRYLKDRRNGLEYAKHFYDIKNLQETAFSMKDCGQAFNESIEMQSKIRTMDLSVTECCEDMLFTCQVASLPQGIGEQLISKIPDGLSSRALSEFRILRKGLAPFQPFLVRKLTYSWDDLRYYAALTALLTKMMQINLPEEKVKAILRSDIPSKKEEIEPLISKIENIPKKDRWFIQSDEIINFPRLLKNWHAYFFLDENT